MSEGKRTVKVRLPVMVASDGTWSYVGWSSRPGEADWVFSHEVLDDLGADDCRRKYWITAEIPIPDGDEVEVDGSVESEATDG